MKVKLWGIRGSLPTPHTPLQIEEKVLALLELFVQQGKGASPQDFLKRLPPDQLGGYGGHTACLQFSTPQTSLIVDGGSGIKNLSDELMKGGFARGQGVAHIFMTHFHWDHLIGLPFFTPVFVPGNEIHFYAVQKDLEENIRQLFKKPTFPVPFEKLPSKIHFHKLTARKALRLGDVDVTPYQLDHPDPCYGYRFEAGGKAIAHCVDTEATRVSREDLGADLKLYQNADLMIFDAQYSFLEATEKVDWGHASGPVGIDLALREGVKQVLFIHHDPSASDQKIAKIENQTRAYYEACLRAAETLGTKIQPLEWCFAREGMQISV